MDVAFVVTTRLVESNRRPVVGVDGPVQGADVCFDHHTTGERVNLLAVPEAVPFPGTIATTMLDSDAIISAAVVLLRGKGENSEVRAVREALYEAAHYCDYLLPSGNYPQAEEAGLGLHCWLKEKGFTLGEVRAWAVGELRPDGNKRLRPVPSQRTQSEVFRDLTLALVTAIQRGSLPRDFTYMERLKEMEREAKRAILRVEGNVTVLSPDRYIDPLALYHVVDTDLVVIMGKLANGVFRYSIGVHPRAYSRRDLRPVFDRLNTLEPGWGGRANAGGSPFVNGSRISVDDLLALLTSSELKVRSGGMR